MMDHFRQAFLRETRHVLEVIAGDFQRLVGRRQLRAAEADLRRKAGASRPVAAPQDSPIPSGQSSDPLDWLPDALATLRATMADEARAAGRRVEVEIDAAPVVVALPIVEAISAALGCVARARITTCPVPRERGSRRTLVRVRLVAHGEPDRVVVAFEDDGGPCDAALLAEVRSHIAAVGGTLAAAGGAGGGGRIAIAVPRHASLAETPTLPSVELAGSRR